MARSSFLADKPLPVIANCYTYNPKLLTYDFFLSLGNQLTRPSFHWAMNGGYDTVTLELPVGFNSSPTTITVPAGGTLGAILGASGLPMVLGGAPLPSNATTVTTVQVVAPGHVVQLVEQGGDGSVIYQGIVEDLPDVADASATHQILLAPMVTMLPTLNYTAEWVNEDPAVMLQDIVSQCSMLTWSPDSIPSTNLRRTMSFANVSGLQAVTTIVQSCGAYFYFHVDEVGHFWLCKVNLHTPTFNLVSGSDYSSRAITHNTSSLCNYILVLGGPVTYDQNTLLLSNISLDDAGFSTDVWRPPPNGTLTTTPDLGYVVTIDQENLAVTGPDPNNPSYVRILARGYNNTTPAPHVFLPIDPTTGLPGRTTVTVASVTLTDTGPTQAIYDAVEGSQYPKRELSPPPVYTNITDQATLQSIANALGMWLNRVMTMVTLHLPLYKEKILLGGGVPFARLNLLDYESSSFEGGTRGGWTAVPGTLRQGLASVGMSATLGAPTSSMPLVLGAITPDQATPTLSGSRHWLIAVPDSGGDLFAATPEVAVNLGQQYTGRITVVPSASGQHFDVVLRWLAPSGEIIHDDFVTAQSSLAGIEQDVAVTAIAPLAAVGAVLGLRITGSANRPSAVAAVPIEGQMGGILGHAGAVMPMVLGSVPQPAGARAMRTNFISIPAMSAVTGSLGAQPGGMLPGTSLPPVFAQAWIIDNPAIKPVRGGVIDTTWVPGLDPNKLTYSAPVATTWEADVNPLLESYTGSGRASQGYVVSDVVLDGVTQTVTLTDLPFTAEDLSYLMNTAQSISATGVSSAVMSNGGAAPTMPTGLVVTGVGADGGRGYVTLSWALNPNLDHVRSYWVRWLRLSDPGHPSIMVAGSTNANARLGGLAADSSIDSTGTTVPTQYLIDIAAVNDWGVSPFTLPIPVSMPIRGGLVQLVAGRAVVSAPSVTGSTRIQLTIQSLSGAGTPSALAVSAVVPGASFTIVSASAVDTSTIAYSMTEPA